ncbi:MAG: MBOAT family protein [Myxococcota bacterium]|nr:MBOAT family protein [Myxococcota bacterium]
MLFNTAQFGIFLFAVLAIYWGLSRYRTLRLGFLLLASYYFYASWNAAYLLLIGAVTLVDYLGALALVKVPLAGLRRLMLTLIVLANLAVLGYWKYTNFLIDAFRSYLGYLDGYPTAPLDIILPVGISFFVFQGLSYVVDVYRGDSPVERSLPRFALYIAFFPQLVAGPIIRAKDLLFQFEQDVRLTTEQTGLGLYMILCGLLKKAIFADYLAANLLDRVYDNPTSYSSLEVLGTVYGYGLQIYGDFSGYTDIAIGVALLLGFVLPPNFNLPYRAIGLQDFWRRWHISLSTWLRDYLYIPLGGSRGGQIATYRNLFITMLLGGLWHGASWNFVIWGAFHGIGLSLWRLSAAGWTWMQPRFGLPDLDTGIVRALRTCLTLHFVLMLWIFFRAQDFESAIAIFTQLASFTPGTANLSAAVVGVLIVGYAIHYAPLKWHNNLRQKFVEASWVAQSIITVSVLWILRFLSLDTPQQFIYFQF